MSVLKTLTEGIVERNLQQEGEALLNKWEKTGLLEGLDNDFQRQGMSRLLENQAKQLLKEASSMSQGDVEGFSAVAFPIVRRVFGGLIANDIVSVQPMSLPSGLIFFLDFTYNTARFGNQANYSVYGTDKVGSQITGGVNIENTTYSTNEGGPYLMGGTYASPSGSSAVTPGNLGTTAFIDPGMSAETDTNMKSIRWDGDLVALSGSIFVIEVPISKSALTGAAGASPTTELTADYENLTSFTMTGDELANIVSGNNGVYADIASSNTKQLRRLTQDSAPQSDGAGLLTLYFATTSDYGEQGAIDPAAGTTSATMKYAIRDNFNAGSAIGSVIGADPWGLEEAGCSTGAQTCASSTAAKDIIPEIDIKVDSVAVTAETKKLKAKWTPELGQDLNAYHNLDAEVELTSILSEQIALEIDRELLQDLLNGATAGVRYWSRSPGLFVNRTTGAEVGASTAAPDFTGTVSEWYETLCETINDVSALIHRKTLRGGANFVVCGPEVANILEFTAGFRASITADVDKGQIGALKTGTLSKKFEIYVDPYFLRNVILVGRKGSSFLESGYVYAPYVPLQVTPTIFGVEDFVPRKGVMTRYARKMVRPDMYGLVVIRGLDGETGG